MSQPPPGDGDQPPPGHQDQPPPSGGDQPAPRAQPEPPGYAYRSPRGYGNPKPHRKQLSSKTIALGAVSVVAVAVGAYACASSGGKETTAYCVSRDDATGGITTPTPTPMPSPSTGAVQSPSVTPFDTSFQVVDDTKCGDPDTSRSHTGLFFWYFGGRLVGSRVTGGTLTKPSGTIKTRSGRTISRGGFGGRGGRGGG